MWRILRRPVRCKLPTLNNRWNTSTRLESTKTSAITADLNAPSAELYPEILKRRTALNAREAAIVIVARCTEKSINLVIKSFECAQNRPRRLIKLITRNGVDVGWLNDWFALVHTNPSAPLYPIEVTDIAGLDAAKEGLSKALIDVNKFYNILADDKDADSKGESQTEKAVTKFCDEECLRVPVGVSIALAEAIQKFKAEEYNVATLKRKLKLAAGIHVQILPGIFKILGFTFTAKTSVGYQAQKSFTDILEGFLLSADKVASTRRARKELLCNKLTPVDPLDEAFLVSGSNPGSQKVLDDACIGTELSSLAKIVMPRTVELRRRSLKTEHCLQITIDVGEPMMEDTYGGYDDYQNNTEQDQEIEQEQGNIFSARGQAESKSGSPADYEKNEIEEAWSSSYYKIFIENISQEIDKEGLANALRKCGPVSHIEFMRCNSDGPGSAALGGEQEPLTATSLLEKFGIESDARLRTCANGSTRRVLLPKNPLAVITSVKLKPVKKTLVKDVTSDLGAFVMMADFGGYMKVTRDDMRIFGICVGGQKSRVVSVETMRTLYLESTACISAKNIKSFLSVTLGSNRSYEITNSWANNGARRHDKFAQYDPVDSDFAQNKVMPVFVVLRFSGHHQAWESHTRILRAIGKGAPFRLAWTKTNWYHSVKMKAREMNVINNMLMEDSEFYVKSWGEQARGVANEIDDELSSDELDDMSAGASDSLGVESASQKMTIPVNVDADDTIDLMKIEPPAKKRGGGKSAIATQEELARKTAREVRNSSMFPLPSSSHPSRAADHYYNSDDEQYSSADKLRA